MNLLDWAERPDWMAEAHCRGQNALFFTQGSPGGGPTAETYRRLARARAICADCPFVDAECLEWALTAGGGGGPAKHGVWAGRTYDELKAVARERRMVNA